MFQVKVKSRIAVALAFISALLVWAALTDSNPATVEVLEWKREGARCATKIAVTNRDSVDAMVRSRVVVQVAPIHDYSRTKITRAHFDETEFQAQIRAGETREFEVDVELTAPGNIVLVQARATVVGRP
jgi:hypothetical protein